MPDAVYALDLARSCRRGSASIYVLGVNGFFFGLPQRHLPGPNLRSRWKGGGDPRGMGKLICGRNDRAWMGTADSTLLIQRPGRREDPTGGGCWRIGGIIALLDSRSRSTKSRLQRYGEVRAFCVMRMIYGSKALRGPCCLSFCFVVPFLLIPIFSIRSSHDLRPHFLCPQLDL